MMYSDDVQMTCDVGHDAVFDSFVLLLLLYFFLTVVLLYYLFHYFAAQGFETDKIVYVLYSRCTRSVCL